ncbi:unnamed protein product [Caenorhabditis brenneri]
MPCPIHSQRPLALYESLDSISSSNIHHMELLREQKRAQSLQVFLAEDFISIVKTKQHLKVSNEVLGPILFEEDTSINQWKCFREDVVPKKNCLKRQHTKKNPSEAPSSKVHAPSGFNIDAPVFVPRKVSECSSTSSSSSSGSSSPTPPSSGSFTFNVGVVNATKSGMKTKKHYLDDNAFVIVPTDDTDSPRTVKVFTAEELQKQKDLVEEFKKKVLSCN